MGRLERQKAFHYAIEGFARLTKEFSSLRLKIVGAGILENDLKKCANDFGVRDRVDFEGFKKDIIPYYLGAKATLLTSLYEGFPKDSMTRIATRKSFNLFFIVLFTETTHKGVIKVVNIINKIEIPSMPTL